MKVLFLTHRLPYAPNRGDRIRAHHLLKSLREHATVHVVSLVHSREEASHVADLDDIVASVTPVFVPRYRNLVRGVLALPTRRPLTHVLLDAPDLSPTVERVARSVRPDVVLAFCTGVAPLAMSGALSGTPFVLDMVDVDSEKWRALTEKTAQPLRSVYTRETNCLRRFEARAMSAASETLVVNGRERTMAHGVCPQARVRVVPNGIDAAAFRPPSSPSGEPVVVFCGVMDYPPNVAAALRLGRIWPSILQQRPEARLQLVGSNPVRAVRQLASVDGRIEVTGAVADVRPFLWNAAVAAAPLTTARGVQNKVLEAVAAGLPVVITDEVAQGLPASVLSACVNAATDEEIVSRIVEILGHAPAARRARAARADLSGLDWSNAMREVPEVLREAMRAGPRLARESDAAMSPLTLRARPGQSESG